MLSATLSIQALSLRTITKILKTHTTDKALGSVSLWLTGMFVCPFMPCGTPGTITFHVALSSMLTWAPVQSPRWKPRVKAKTGLTWDVLGGFAPQLLKSVTWIAFSFETFAILDFYNCSTKLNSFGYYSNEPPLI